MSLLSTTTSALLLLLGIYPFGDHREHQSPPLLSIELFAKNERVIPLSFEWGEFQGYNLKPPALVLKNNSDGPVTVTRASLVGRSGEQEVVRYTVHEELLDTLMTAQNRRINRQLNGFGEAATHYRVLRTLGDPTMAEPDYIEGNRLPPASHAFLGLDDAFLVLFEGKKGIDALEIILETRTQDGDGGASVLELPVESFFSENEYRFPIDGPSTVGNGPFSHSHRFANGQEFALDIVDVRRFEDGRFSTSRVPNETVIMGSDRSEDYYIYGRPVRAMADGTVIAIEDRYPDEIASNPRERMSQRTERLRQKFVDEGRDPEDLPSANFVLIDHGNGEFARFCHLREDVPVNPGDEVKQGDIIGYVGNSGASMEPHLHLELLDSPDYASANGLPIVFTDLNLGNALDSPSFGRKNSLLFSDYVFVIARWPNQEG